MSFTPRPFLFPTRTPSWFLGHMVRSLRALPALLEDIDLVIEARDARLALTSINPTFDNILAKAWGSRKGKERADEREKVVVYTKRDLAEGRFEVPLIKAFKSHMNQQVFFADTRSDADVKSILRHAVHFAKGREEGLKVLVVGMPNVGKSSLLNALRRVGMHKGKAFRTGAEAGITRRLTGTVKIFESPLVYVYDTPGVMIPYLGHGIIGAERGLKLALTAGIKEGLFERDVIVDYLLWRMNIKLTQQQHLPLDQRDPTYLDLLPLPLTFTQPTEDPQTLLSALAQRLGALRKGGEPDLEASATYLIRAFREGKLGPWTLDDLTSISQISPTSHDDPVLEQPDIQPTQSAIESVEEDRIEESGHGGEMADMDHKDKDGPNRLPIESRKPRGLKEEMGDLNGEDLEERVSKVVKYHLDLAEQERIDTSEGKNLSISQQRKVELKEKEQVRLTRRIQKGFVTKPAPKKRVQRRR